MTAKSLTDKNPQDKTGSSGASSVDEDGGMLQIENGCAAIYTVSGNGTIDFSGSLSGSGILFQLDGGAMNYAAGTLLQHSDSFAFGGTTPSSLDIVDPRNFQTGFKETITGFDYGDQLQFGTLDLTGDGFSYNAHAHSLTITDQSGATVLSLSNLFLAGDVSAAPQFELHGNVVQLACFLSGTRIAGEKGSIAVEDIRPGDQLPVFEAGVPCRRPVAWVGSTRVSAMDYPEEDDAYPIRIRAEAFAPGLPEHDLLVTGDHGICIDNGLIPARMLVNDRSIIRDTGLAEYTVHHVEFEKHSIMLAEGVPVESYLDTGNRASFGVPVSHAGQAAMRHHAGIAAPLTLSRAAVEPVWLALLRRAELLGIEPVAQQADETRLSDDPELRLLLEDGRTLAPKWQSGKRHIFHLPHGARPGRLVSRTARPSRSVGAFVDDRRRLGVAVQRIVRWDGLSDTVIEARELNGRGWHHLENNFRWTDGEAELSLAGASGEDVFLEVEIAARLRYQTPEQASVS